MQHELLDAPLSVVTGMPIRFLVMIGLPAHRAYRQYVMGARRACTYLEVLKDDAEHHSGVLPPSLPIKAMRQEFRGSAAIYA